MRLIEEMAWLAPAWQRLGCHIQTDRVPHALLIASREGVGELQLAEAFGQRLLCRQSQEYACGVCPSCKLYLAGTHPDCLRIAPEEVGKIIPIDAIRGLIATLALKPQYSGRRVVFINPAHQMNVASANSLLKTLEEPDEHTTLLLLTHAPHLLPATILSRCQRLNLPDPSHQEALAWLSNQGHGAHAEVLLALARGAPVKAASLDEDGMIAKRGEFFQAWCGLAKVQGEPVAVAEQWGKFSCETLVDWMISWTMDLIRLGAAPQTQDIDNQDLRESLQEAARDRDLPSMFACLDRLNAAQKTLAGQVNRQMVLEDVLIRWMHS